MLRLERPPEVEDFALRARELRAEVKRSIDRDKGLRFRDLWTDFKSVFAAAQHGKCGYCESRVLPTGTGQIDHYRPKGSVSELGEDPQTWGHEEPASSKVVGRRTSRISDRGYWWLGYEWRNFVFSCERCNVGWKRDLFPVRESPRPLPPAPEHDETPLLLEPFGGENPSAHLRFDWWGNVEAADGSKVGYETIRTLGLDRDSLREAREDVARTAHQLIRELRQAASEEEKRELLSTIHDLGRARRPYAGMVRIIFEVETGDYWASVEPQPPQRS